MNWIGWVANGFLIAGTLGVGEKWPGAFVLLIIGECLWSWKTARMKQWDMLAICVIFAALAARNLYLWTAY